MKDARNIPAIRFKEFSEAWEQRKLGAFSIKVSSKNTNRLITETLTNSAEEGIISQTDYFDREISNAENIDGYYVVEPDDFVYNPRISTKAPVGPINRNRLGRKGIMSPLYTVFRIDDTVNKLFLEFYFKTSCWHPFMKYNGDSGARSDRFSIKNDIFFSMEIGMPLFEEQRKIGKLLEHVSTLITLHQRKIDALKTLKKALLAEMFPDNGSDKPLLRFKGFNDAWEQRRLGEIGDVITGTTPDTNNSEYYSDDGIPWVTPTDIISDVTFSSAKKLSELGREVARVVPRNSILVTCIASIGKNTILGTEGSFNQQINCIIPREKEFDPYFLYSESVIWANEMRGWASSGTMQIVNKSEFSALVTCVPNYYEQGVIGQFFYKIDTLITLHQRKLEGLKTMKTFLLQNMFI